MAELEAGTEIERIDLLFYRLVYFGYFVSQAAGPKPRQTIKNLSTVTVSVIPTLSRHHNARIFFKLAITSKRHPVSIQLSAVYCHYLLQN